MRPRHLGYAALAAALSGATSHALAQSTSAKAAQAEPLSLGFAVDTSVVPDAWWGVDPAQTALPSVVRAWNDYLAIRSDASKRVEFWSDEGRGTVKPEYIKEMIETLREHNLLPAED